MQTYTELGSKLKAARLSQNQSLADVASAIKLNRTYISKIENGLQRPSYKVLQVLISHYSLSKVEAIELSKLAGYTVITIPTQRGEVTSSERKGVFEKMENIAQQQQPQQLQVSVPNNMPVLYTDSAFVTANDYGIVFDFAQSMASTNQQTVVTRVGMSKEHAKALLKVLSQKLLETELVEKKNKKGEN